MDRILIKDLLVRCIIGVGDQERRDKQDVVINVALWADLTTACRTDRIEDTVNYSTIKKRIISGVEQSQFCLVETLAQRVADICLEDEDVKRVQITVEKPTALRFARSVGVEITRERT